MQFVSPANFNKFNQIQGGGNGAAYYWTAGTLALPYGFSLTRSGTNATYFDSAGLLQTAGADVARFSYNPATLALKGLMVEQAATNLCPRSTKMADVTAWATNFSAATADQSVYLDGTTTMASFAPSNVVGLASPYFYEYTNPGITVTANTEYCVSVDVKRKAGTMGLRVWWVVSGFTSGVRADFDLTGVAASTVTTVGTGSSTGTPRIENQGSGIYRVSLSGKIDAATTTGFLVVEATKAYQDGTAYTPNGTDGFYVCGAQVELGNAPTSRIVTAAASATRNADVLTAPTSGLLVNGQGFAAMGYEVIACASAGTGVQLSTYNGGTEGIPMYTFSGNVRAYDGTSFDVGPANALTVGQTYSTASTWGGSSIAMAESGTVVSGLSFDGSMSLGTTMRIGAHVDATAPFSLYLKSLRLGQVVLSSGQLANMTA